MNNPFEQIENLIEAKFSNIETLLAEFKKVPKIEVKQTAYSIREGADFFHVSPVTFMNWKRKGLVKYTQVGRKLIIDLPGTMELLSAKKKNRK